MWPPVGGDVREEQPQLGLLPSVGEGTSPARRKRLRQPGVKIGLTPPDVQDVLARVALESGCVISFSKCATRLHKR